MGSGLSSQKNQLSLNLGFLVKRNPSDNCRVCKCDFKIKFYLSLENRGIFLLRIYSRLLKENVAVLFSKKFVKEQELKFAKAISSRIAVECKIRNLRPLYKLKKGSIGGAPADINNPEKSSLNLKRLLKIPQGLSPCRKATHVNLPSNAIA